MNSQVARFITIEGIEGAGKSTALSTIQRCLTESNIPVYTTREPGGTQIAEGIRQVLLKRYDEVLAPETELLLMFAGRVQHLKDIIKPALARGEWVISDRFIDASYAYQGGGRGIDTRCIQFLEHWLVKQNKPDLTLLLDIPVAMSTQRIAKRDAHDRFEQEAGEFFERVRTVYLERAAQEPERFYIIDASSSLSDVQAQIKAALAPLVAEFVHSEST